MYICINVAEKPTSFSEKVNSMSIAFQKSTKEVEKIANQLSAHFLDRILDSKKTSHF